MKIENIIEIELLWDETGTSLNYYTIYINHSLDDVTWSSHHLDNCRDDEIHAIIENIGSGIFTAKMEIELIKQFITDAIFDNVKIETILDGLQSRKDLIAVAIDFMYESGYIKMPRNRL